MTQFHPFWYLTGTTPESLPPIDPRLLVLEPQKNRTRGRPKGAKNKPTLQEEAITQATAMAMDSETPDSTSSTHRIASRFEVTLQEGRSRRRGRGRPRGSRHTGTRGTTCRRIIPESQPNGPGVNPQTSEGGSRGSRGRGRGSLARGGSSRIDGVPDTMINNFQL
jgi:hypothetical protein